MASPEKTKEELERELTRLEALAELARNSARTAATPYAAVVFEEMAQTLQENIAQLRAILEKFRG
jgi:hypothetical protein